MHVVKNFGLLSTQFVRYDGCRIWVRRPAAFSLLVFLDTAESLYTGHLLHSRNRPV